MPANRSSRRKKTATVNFKDAKSNRIPEGTYPARVVAAEIQTSKDSGEDYIAWQFEVSEGDHEGKVGYFNTSLQPQALFRVRETLEAIGVEVPDGKMTIDPEEYVGGEAEIEVMEDEYQGRKQSKIVEVGPLKKSKKSKKTEVDDDHKKKGKKKSKTLQAADVEDMDEDELADLVEEHDLEVDLDRFRTRAKKAKAVIEALVDAEIIEGDDTDEDD